MGAVSIAGPDGPEPSGSEAPAEPGEVHKLLDEGTRVDVRDRFQGRWTHGFVVAEATPDAYRLRRLSDDSVLPGHFAHDSVRRERRRRGTWWY
jgi:hypothetical protein